MICSLISLRYASHAQRRLTVQRTQRTAAVQAATQQAKLLRYLPQAVQQQQQQGAEEGVVSASSLSASPAASAGSVTGTLGGTTVTAGVDGKAGGSKEDEVAVLVHALLAARFVAWQAAAYVGYISTGNLLTSFSAGLLLQLFNTWACGVGAGGDQDSNIKGGWNGQA